MMALARTEGVKRSENTKQPIPFRTADTKSVPRSEQQYP